MELFLQKAIPKMKPASFDKEQMRIICTRYCFFSVHEGASSGIGELVFKDDRTMKVIKSGHEKNGHYHPLAIRAMKVRKLGQEKNGHYHPLAIRAVASFLHDRLLDNSGQSWDGSIMLPYSREDIFSILRLEFDSLSHKAKQLFIDVALYAPPPHSDDLYDWLLAVHGGSDNGVVMVEVC